MLGRPNQQRGKYQLKYQLLHGDSIHAMSELDPVSAKEC